MTLFVTFGVMHSLPEGHYTNGWDVNVAGVRTTSVKRNIRYHKHAVCQPFTDVREMLTRDRNSS